MCSYNETSVAVTVSCMYMYMYVYISFIEAERGEGERNRHTSSRMTDGLMEFPAWAAPLASVWVLVTGQSGLLREQGVGRGARCGPGCMLSAGGPHLCSE